MARPGGRAIPNRVAVTVGFSEELAHLIEGGSDIFLMPSRFEPCGLNQMYSLRYGTVPVVRATGGLDDTVTDVDEATGEGTGFKFQAYTTGAMMEALQRAPVLVRDGRPPGAASSWLAWRRTTPGRRRRGSTSRCTSGPTGAGAAGLTRAG